MRLIDLLALAVDDVRQGGDPRLPLELALVKVTRPGADLSRQSLSFRLEQLETKLGAPAQRTSEPAAPAPATQPSASTETETETETERKPKLELNEIQTAWKQAILPAIGERSIPAASVLNEARPVELAGERLVIEFPPAASFHRNLAEEPKNASLLSEVLYEVTGRRLTLAFAIGEGQPEQAEAEVVPTSEEDIISLMKSTFDAREVDET
jgi:hypothetical protein